MKILETFLLLIPFLNISKKHSDESEITYDCFFAYTLFKYLKKHTYESENTWDNFFAHTLFKYLKKANLEI